MIAIAVVAGCGGSDSPQTTGAKAPPAPQPRPEQGARSLPVGDGNGGVKLTSIGQFDEPLFVTQPDGAGGDLYVVERGGTIRVVHGGQERSEPFLDIRDLVGDGFQEQGLLSMAFSPDYRRSGLFYADYTDNAGDTRVVEYRRSRDDPLRADEDSARVVLGVDQPFENHNGGLLLFGADDELYIGLGDGGSAGDPQRNGQSLGTLLAKILRIDPRPRGGSPYGIPEDNPFASKDGARPEIYDYGLRNPWRFSFDRKTGALLIGDVGQDQFEEIDYLPPAEAAGANLGWSAFEGDARYNDDQSAPGAVRPILTYGRDRGCSVTGGYVVRDPGLSSLYGRYIYGDFCVGQLRSFVPATGGARGDRALGPDVPGLSSFGEDLRGHIYATSLEGPVYRLDPAG